MSKRALAAIVLIYILISHVILPELNNGQDFLLFTKWSMFAGATPAKTVLDISWDGGQSFLFRNYRKEARISGVDINSLFYLLTSGKLDAIRKQHKVHLLDLCKCNSVRLYTLQTSLYDHIVKRSSGSTVSSEEL